LSYFDERIINIGISSISGVKDRSRHEQAVDTALSAGEDVPAYVLKDYPELAALYEIDISNRPPIDFEPVRKYLKLHEMPKDEYDRILDEVKADCDNDPKHVTDKMLNQDYEEELVDCKRSAKLRKKVFNNLPEHMQFGYTLDTMDAKLHKSMVWYAKNNNLKISDEVKAGYPTTFTDVPFTYEITGNEECDKAANDILTQIRNSVEKGGYDANKLSHTIHSIIGAKNFKSSTMKKVVSMAYNDGIRSYQSGGVLMLGTYDTKTVAHEYGHAIDWMLPEINELSQAFLNRRTEDEPLVSLAEIIPQGGYTDDELAKPDNFMEAYIGKRYDHSSSEVLSMGMGYLSSSGGMMAMYEQDPEYLGYILAVLSGRARGAEVIHGPMRGSDEPGGFEPANKSETIEIDLYKLSRSQMVDVIKILDDKGLLKFELPDELLEAIDIAPKKMSPEALKAMFTALKEKGLLKDKPGDKKSADKKPDTKDPEDAQGSGRPGLVKKKVTVRRGSKTSEEYRWVKAGEDEPTEKKPTGEVAGEVPRKSAEPEKPKGPVILGLNKPEGKTYGRSHT
jgi:hypothetical protein